MSAKSETSEVAIKTERPSTSEGDAGTTVEGEGTSEAATGHPGVPGTAEERQGPAESSRDYEEVHKKETGWTVDKKKGSMEIPTVNSSNFNTRHGICVSVYMADITKLKVDIVVNAANGNLRHGGGVAAAIATAAGQQLVAEGDDYIRLHGRLQVSNVVDTTGGFLQCKRVVHAVGPKWDDYDDKPACEQLLVDTICNCLKLSSSLKCSSVAIPSISSALFGVPQHICARAYLLAIKTYDSENGEMTSLKRIHFVDVNEDMTKQIRRTFEEGWSESLTVTSLNPPEYTERPPFTRQGGPRMHRSNTNLCEGGNGTRSPTRSPSEREDQLQRSSRSRSMTDKGFDYTLGITEKNFNTCRNGIEQQILATQKALREKNSDLDTLKTMKRKFGQSMKELQVLETKMNELQPCQAREEEMELITNQAVLLDHGLNLEIDRSCPPGYAEETSSEARRRRGGSNYTSSTQRSLHNNDKEAVKISREHELRQLELSRLYKKQVKEAKEKAEELAREADRKAEEAAIEADRQNEKAREVAEEAARESKAKAEEASRESKAKAEEAARESKAKAEEAERESKAKAEEAVREAKAKAEEAARESKKKTEEAAREAAEAKKKAEEAAREADRQIKEAKENADEEAEYNRERNRIEDEANKRERDGIYGRSSRGSIASSRRLSDVESETSLAQSSTNQWVQNLSSQQPRHNNQGPWEPTTGEQTAHDQEHHRRDPDHYLADDGAPARLPAHVLSDQRASTTTVEARGFKVGINSYADASMPSTRAITQTTAAPPVVARSRPAPTNSGLREYVTNPAYSDAFLNPEYGRRQASKGTQTTMVRVSSEIAPTAFERRIPHGFTNSQAVGGCIYYDATMPASFERYSASAVHHSEATQCHIDNTTAAEQHQESQLRCDAPSFVQKEQFRGTNDCREREQHENLEDHDAGTFLAPRHGHELPPTGSYEANDNDRATRNVINRSQGDHVQTVRDTLASALMLGRLPRQEPTIFLGDPMEYPAWYASFSLLVGNQEIQPSEKLLYLKSFLGGSALQAVSGYFLVQGPKAYSEAMAILEQRYGQSIKVGQALRDKLDNWENVHAEDPESFRRFSDFLLQCAMAQDEIGGLTSLDTSDNIRRLMEKLPPTPRNGWARKVAVDLMKQPDRYPTFREFTAYVAAEAGIANEPVYGRLSNKRFPKPPRPDSQRTPGRSERDQRVSNMAVEAQATSKPPCTYCADVHHTMAECPKFASLRNEERTEFNMKNKLCHSCLKNEGHIAKNCKRRKTCLLCGRRHPTSMHSKGFTYPAFGDPPISNGTNEGDRDESGTRLLAPIYEEQE